MTRASRTDALPDEQDKSRAVEEMFDRIAPRYDVLNRLMTLRMDMHWRRITVRQLAMTPGSIVVDLACGTGDLCRTLASAGYRPVGIDFSAGMLRAARARAPLVRADALRLPVRDAACDGVTCGFGLRNFSDIEPAIAECARALRPGGRIALLEVAEPKSPALRALHGVYFRHVVPFVGGLLSDKPAYRYLPASTAYLPEVPDLLMMMTRAGFVSVSHRMLGLGAAQLITGTRS
ncbi:MAG TPA: ubiquinone/menaquinone biosynthesis methyltransferase [Acidimicrobiia bacterium]|nr:ubiquinone/menaquinone biosynthesis methyltransferase [Acidimicrobiia bacterium]